VTAVTALNVNDFPYSVHCLPFWTEHNEATAWLSQSVSQSVAGLLPWRPKFCPKPVCPRTVCDGQRACQTATTAEIGCKRWCKKSVSHSNPIQGISWCAMTIILETSSSKEACSVFCFYGWYTVSPLSKFIAKWRVYGDDVITVQPIRKWHRLFENGQMNSHDDDDDHDDDSAGMPSPARADVNPEPVEELVFVSLIKHFRGCWPYSEEMEMAVYEWLPVQEPDFYHNIIVKFVTKMRNLHQCGLWLFWKIMVCQCNDRATFNYVMLSQFVLHLPNLPTIVHCWWWPPLRLLPCLAVCHMPMTSHLRYLHHPCCCSYSAYADTHPVIWGLILDLEKLCTAVLGTVTTAMGLRWLGLGAG